MENIICHRGALAYAPENTMAAFAKAVALGGNFVEFDVMLSADGEAFVFHDENVSRTTNGRGEFGKLTSEYLRSLDAGSWFSKDFSGEKIPTFREVLQYLARVGCRANIEIKPYPGCSEQTTIVTCSEIYKYWPGAINDLLVSSFDLDVLRLCCSIAPEMPIGLLVNKWDNGVQECALALRCYSLHLNKCLVTKKRVQDLKALGFWLAVFTVNCKREARKLLSWGVDAIFSDYPDL